ncbi:MAG: hypothetical protein LBG50_00250 [Clostridiales Family XIII bacterium]|nr:hypothetical protein [Clostridiales Family XIII bacterium]
MQAIFIGRKRVRALLASALALALAVTGIFAAAPSASAASPAAPQASAEGAAGASAAPSEDYSPSSTTDYIAAKFDGISANAHVFDVVTVERLTKGVLGQDGNSVVVLGSPKNDSTKKSLRYINDVAQAWGIEKIYFFDPNLAGEAGADITDASTGAPYAARTDSPNNRIWAALKTAVTTGTDNLRGARLKHIPAGYTSDQTLLFVYNRKPSGAIVDSADTIVSSLLIPGAVDVGSTAAQNALKSDIAAVFSAVPGWTSGNTGETFYDQYWWFRNVWTYSSGSIDGITQSKFTVRQVTQPELVNVLNTPGTHNVFISGSWCGDSRALTAYLAENASKANEPVYVFDFRVSGGIGDSSAYSVLRSEAPTSDGGYGYTGLGFIGARLVDLFAPFESGTVNTVSKYYPNGDSSAQLATSPNRNFRSPFLVKYQKGNNSSKGSVVKEWVHQTQEWEAPWKSAAGYEGGQLPGTYLDYEVATGGTNQLQNARARYALAEFFGQPSVHSLSGYSPSSTVGTNVSKSDSGCGDDNDPLDDLGESRLIPNQGTSDYDVQSYDIAIDASSIAASSDDVDFIKGATTVTAIAKKGLSHIELDFKPLAVNGGELRVNVGSIDESGAFVASGSRTVTHFSQASNDAEDLQKLALDVNSPIASGTPFQIFVSYTTGLLDTFVGNGESPQGFFSRIDEGGIAAIGEPLGAIYWFPNNNTPADGAKYAITLKYPSGYEGVAPGVRTSRSGTQSVWKVNRDIASYQAFASIGKYTIVGGTGNNYLSITAPTAYTQTVNNGNNPDNLDEKKINKAIPYYNYVNSTIYAANASRNRDKADAFTHELPLYIRALESIAGPYPGEAAGFVFDNLGDGHGSPASWGAVETADRPFFTGTNITSERTFVHEYAHQWYGDAVRIAGWEDLWLNEGFATYVTDLYYEQKPGSEFSAQEKWENVYNSTAANKPWWGYAPAKIETEGDLFGGASAAYNRGALALAALRAEIGDAKFLKILKDWPTEKKGQAVTTADFVAFAAASAGQDLTDWADAWLYGQAKPAAFITSDIPKDPGKGDDKPGGNDDKQQITAKSISGARIAAIKDQIYNGKAAIPAVKVTLNGAALTAADYALTYRSNTGIGLASVTATGKGAYKDSVTATFKILPAKAKLKSAKAGKGRVTLKWSKAKGVTKQQIQYRIKGKAWKSITVSGAAVSKVVKKLKKGKTYQFRIRGYKKAGSEKYQAAWSGIKTVKVRK